mgnify:CR=1 FL=1
MANLLVMACGRLWWAMLGTVPSLGSANPSEKRSTFVLAGLAPSPLERIKRCVLLSFCFALRPPALYKLCDRGRLVTFDKPLELVFGDVGDLLGTPHFRAGHADLPGQRPL